LEPRAVADWRRVGILIAGVRAAERVLPLWLLYALVWPAAALRAAWEFRFSRRRMWLSRIPLNAVKLTLLWPDRLRQPRWRGRVNTVGVDRFERARATGRPVILATLHFGPATAVLPLLRRDRLPVAAITLRDPDDRRAFRKTLQQLADRMNDLEGVPAVIGVADVERAVDFLGAGNVLVLAVDGPRGRRLHTRIGHHTLSLSAAVCQMAAMRHAIIVPCLLTAAPVFRVTMHFGQPVPDALVCDYRRHQAACEHLHREFLPIVSAFPAQCYPVLAAVLGGHDL
jgi:lauroyl/myristoyl acyltransferase